MKDFSTVIQGMVVTEQGVVEGGYVAVRDGLIAQMGSGPAPQANEKFDFGKALVLPGAIDSQVHSRSQALRSGPQQYTARR